MTLPGLSVNLLLRILLSLLALSGVWFSVRAAEAPAKAIASGLQVASRIRFEFAIYYPDHPATQPMAALRRQIAADARMPLLVQAISETESGPVVTGHWIAGALKDYTPPSGSMLKRFGRGLTPAQIEALPRAQSCAWTRESPATKRPPNARSQVRT